MQFPSFTCPNRYVSKPLHTCPHNTLGKALQASIAPCPVPHPVHQNPHMLQSRSTRTLDTGIRFMNIMEALQVLLFEGCITDEELELVLHSMYEQLCYLKQEYLPKYLLSNWGSIQTCAILSSFPMLCQDYQQDLVFRWAIKQVKQQFELQVYDDGMHWEQSTMYHIEVLNYAMKLIFYQRFYNYTLLEIMEKQTYALCDALFYQMTLSRMIETFGDSDRVCTLMFCTEVLFFFNRGYGNHKEIQITIVKVCIPWV